MDVLTNKERKYLQRACQSVKFLPIAGGGIIVFAVLLAIIAGIKYEQFIRYITKIDARYNSYLQSMQPITELEKKLVKQLRQEKEFNEKITKMNFILVGFIGALMLGGLISTGVQLLTTGIIHRRYLKIIEKITPKE